MVIGKKKKALREEWHRWARAASRYAGTEQALDRIVTVGDTRQVHRYDFPVSFCSDLPDQQPMRVQAEVTLERVHLFAMPRTASGELRYVNVMEWAFDRYAVQVSDDEIEVRFQNSADAEDPGNRVYIRDTSAGGDLGYRVNVALDVRRDGLEQYRRALRDLRLAHLAHEPDRSAVSAREVRFYGDLAAR